MRNIKSYQEFSNEETNEEINWKKAAAGVALGAGLAFGSPAKGQSKLSDRLFGWGEQPQTTKTVKQDTVFKSSEDGKVLGVFASGKYDIFEKNLKSKGFKVLTSSSITNQIPNNMRILGGNYQGNDSEIHTMVSNDDTIQTVAIISTTPIDRPAFTGTKICANYNDSLKFLFESYNRLSKDKEKIVLNLGKFHQQYKQGLITSVAGGVISLIGLGLYTNSVLNPKRETTTKSSTDQSTGVTTTTTRGGGTRSTFFPTILMIAGGTTATVGGIIMIDSHRHLKGFDKSKMGDYEF